MISNKTAVTLLLITLAMKTVASTSRGTQKTGLARNFSSLLEKLVTRSGTRKITTPSLTMDSSVKLVEIQGKNPGFPEDTQRASPSAKSALQVKTRESAPKPKNNIPVLQDTDNTVSPVEVQEGSTEATSTSQELSVPRVDNPFKTLIEKGEYEEIFELGKEMEPEEFMKQLCPVVRTLEKYKGLAGRLKDCKLLASFYVHGDMEVVRNAIITEPKVYDGTIYVENAALRAALPLALKGDHHDRFTDLLNVRKKFAPEEDKQVERNMGGTGFEWYVYGFFCALVPWEDGVALKRFFTLRGYELRDKDPDLLDTLCQKLIFFLKSWLTGPKSKGLLVGLIGQPLLLTPLSFAKGFLCGAFDRDLTNLIKYGWREAIEEGLKKEHKCGGEKLWQAMKKERSHQITGDYPSTVDELAAVLKLFPTKEQLEWQWIKDNASDFLDIIEQVFANIIPTALVSIIIGYAPPTWIDVLSIKSE